MVLIILGWKGVSSMMPFTFWHPEIDIEITLKLMYHRMCACCLGSENPMVFIDLR